MLPWLPGEKVCEMLHNYLPARATCFRLTIGRGGKGKAQANYLTILSLSSPFGVVGEKHCPLYISTPWPVTCSLIIRQQKACI